MSLDLLADIARKGATLDLVTRHACGLTITRFNRAMEYTYASGANIERSGINAEDLVGVDVAKSLEKSGAELIPFYRRALGGEVVVHWWDDSDGNRFRLCWVPLVNWRGQVTEVIKFSQSLTDLEGDSE